jgi:hypothetical protein
MRRIILGALFAVSLPACIVNTSSPSSAPPRTGKVEVNVPGVKVEVQKDGGNRKIDVDVKNK